MVVLYAEVPGFYAAVERARDASLRERPVIVGGDPRRRGLVQDATLDAQAAGVWRGMLMQDALQRCPRARALRTEMARYRTASQVLRACLRRYVERLEPDELGSAFLDPGAAREAPVVLATRLCEAVLSELRLPLRVGVAGTRLAAKLAAEETGETGVCEVPPGGEAAFLADLVVTRLPGVGPTAAAKLEALGVHRIGDLAAAGRGRLEAALGNRGLELLAHAEGQGAAEVRGERHPRSLSLETTLPGPERDSVALVPTLSELAVRLEPVLRMNGLAARRITLKVRFEDGETTTRSVTLVHGIADAGDLEARALELLGRAPAGSRGIRLLGLSVTQFSRVRRDDRQLDLFGNPVRR